MQPSGNTAASPAKRAERRLAELLAAGCDTTLEEVLREIAERDERDTSRSAAPLRRAEDAVEVDTSALTLAESIDAVCRLISDRLGVKACD